MVDAAQNVLEVMLQFAPGSSEFSARWRHWFNFAVAMYTAKTIGPAGEAVHQYLLAASLGPTREDRALIPGTEARPADVLLPNWTGGKDTALDVTVINPLQTNLVAQAATTPRSRLERGLQQEDDPICRGL